MPNTTIITPILTRFRSKVVRGVDPDVCWQWTATLTDGYGMLWDQTRQRMVLAHRYSYETFVGPIPPGMQIDHLCRVRSCTNPAHLEAVSQRENMRRAGAAGALGSVQRNKTHCPQDHEYTEANTYRHGGSRKCRECMRVRNRIAASRRRAAA